MQTFVSSTEDMKIVSYDLLSSTFQLEQWRIHMLFSDPIAIAIFNVPCFGSQTKVSNRDLFQSLRVEEIGFVVVNGDVSTHPHSGEMLGDWVRR